MGNTSFYSSIGVTAADVNAIDDSKNAAAASATAAAASETSAATSATNAAASEAAAAGSETNAATSETNAAASATAAASSEANASTSETNAAASETAAATSATSASTSAAAAAVSESIATTSATAAAASETAAAASETAAAASETAAAASQTASAASETAAATSATNAATSETNAATSAATATTQASNASTSAAAASTSETNAGSSAASAATSATTASNAQTAAESARDDAEAALDSFDDRYLGAKASDPTTDNDGDALISGALYFNTTDDVMKVYDGSAWVAAYASLSGSMLTANNLSDVSDVAAARTNLGLVIGTDVQAYSAVLAATTASYTTAEETKLAGVEAGADVTDAANVEPLVDAHINVSGATSGQYLGWNGTDYAWSTVDVSSKVSKSGDTMTGALTLSGAPTSNLHAATKAYVDAEVAGVIDSAPATLDTLNELAAALGDDPNFATTVTTSIGTKLNASSYTAADVLTKIKTVDGSGSGLDADTLDGVQGSSFLRSDASDTMSGSLTFNSSSAYFAEYNGSAADPIFKFKTSGTSNGYVQFTSSGNAYFWNERQGRGFRVDTTPAFYDGSAYRTIWHAGNDGSGSGLDADTVDGIQGSNFLRSDTADSALGKITFSSGAGAITIDNSGDIRSASGGWTGEHSGKIQYHNNEWYLQASTGWAFRNASAVNVMTCSGSGNMTVSGNFTASGNVTAYSDERLKDNVVTIENALDKVSAIRGVTYNRNDIEDAPRHAGVIAQEVEKVLPEVVQTDDDGIKTVAYGNMVGLLIEAIKEQQAQIDELKAKLEG